MSRSEEKFTGPTPGHNHVPDFGKTEAALAIDEMKVRAKGTSEPTSRIVQASKRKLGDEALVHMPKDASLKRAAKRIRADTRPNDPKTLADLDDVASDYSKDLDGDSWILGDNKKRDRVLVFCTTENLRRLTQSTYLIMDGTFKVSPKIFTQLYVIHGLLFGMWAPLVFVLMAKKNKASYHFLFKTLTEEAQSRLHRPITPAYIGVDFESVVIDLIPEYFSSTMIAACLFHLIQIFWRVLQREGLVNKYHDCPDFRAYFRAACGLSLVPEEDVVDCFRLWKAAAPEAMRPLVLHIEEIYVLGKRWGRGRRQPKYPPRIWNCTQRVLQNKPRTSNTAEGWNNRFRVLVGKHHPSLYELLDSLRDEMADAKRSVLQHAYGRSPPKKRVKWSKLDTQIENMVDKYEEYKTAGNQLEYITGIGHNLSGRFSHHGVHLLDNQPDDADLPPAASPTPSSPPPSRQSPPGSPTTSSPPPSRQSPPGSPTTSSPPPSRQSGAPISDRRWIEDDAAKRHRVMKDNPGGGDCGFYALKHSLQESHVDQSVKNLRLLAHGELKKHPATYKSFFTPPAKDDDTHPPPAKTYAQFVQRVKDTEWTNELVIVALAKALPATINVTMSGGKRTAAFGSGQIELHIAHINDEKHYVALMKH